MKSEENVHEGHRLRLKTKFLESADSLEQHEMLELLLFFARPQVNTNEIAHKLLRKFGSLAGVFEADFKSLTEVDGVKEHSATLIKLQLEMFRRYMQDKFDVKNMKLTSENAGEYIKSLFYGYTVEVFYLILLDADFRVISAEKIATGTNNCANISSREVNRIAVNQNASYIILAHNHPNGILIPSAADINATKVIDNGLTFVNVKLIDHIIVAGDKYMSLLNELGRINYVSEGLE